jgi:hypothetical protein
MTDSTHGWPGQLADYAFGPAEPFEIVPPA